jgi:hypothetical protein
MLTTIIGTIQDQIYKTIVLLGDFFKVINIWAVLGGLACLYVVFMRTWEFRKIGSLFITWAVLLLVYVRLEGLCVTSPFSPEGIEMAQMLLRITSGIVAALIFIYHAAVAQ